MPLSGYFHFTAQQAQLACHFSGAAYHACSMALNGACCTLNSLIQFSPLRVTRQSCAPGVRPLGLGYPTQVPRVRDVFGSLAV